MTILKPLNPLNLMRLQVHIIPKAYGPLKSEWVRDWLGRLLNALLIPVLQMFFVGVNQEIFFRLVDLSCMLRVGRTGGGVPQRLVQVLVHYEIASFILD